MLQNNTVVKILSLIIAISLWGYVVWTENPVTSQVFDNVPVQVRNLSSLDDRGLALLGEQEYSVNVKLQGKKKDIGSITANDITATVDIGGFGEGETTVTVDIHTLDNVSVVDVKPNKITFNIDKVVEAEKNITIGMTGELPENTEAGEPTANAETVKIKGASLLVDSVSTVTADIDLNKLADDDTVQTVRIVPKNSNGEEVEGIIVTPGTVELTSALYYTRTVSLDVTVRGEAADGCDVSHVTVPDTVKIRGTQSAVNSVRELNGTVDVTGLASNARVLVSISLPSGVMLSSENLSVTASVSIESSNNDKTDNSENGSHQDDGNGHQGNGENAE